MSRRVTRVLFLFLKFEMHQARDAPVTTCRVPAKTRHTEDRYEDGLCPWAEVGGCSSRKTSAREEFNSYGTRRGNHEILTRATFANIRLRNEMVPGIEGPYTRMPDGTTPLLFEAAQSSTGARVRKIR